MYSGVIYDALNIVVQEELGIPNARHFVLDENISPLDKDSWILGNVFTTRGEEVSAKEYEKLDKIRLKIPEAISNETIVLLEAGDSKVAHAGDITLLTYKKCGIEGFLTDGYVRDSRLIRNELNFPCFCKGTLPIDAINIWALTDFGCPIEMKSVNGNNLLIYNGDLVYADSDGAIIIPKEYGFDVGKHAFRIAEKEEKIRDEFKDGFDLNKIYRTFGRW